MDIDIEKIITFAGSSGITAFVGFKLKEYMIMWQTNKFKLTEHQMFIQLEKAKSEVKKWNVPENKLCLKDALLIKLTTWNKEGIVLAKELEKSKKLSNNKIEKKFLDWALKVIADYTKEWKKIQIPNGVIRIIESKHQKKVDLFLNALNNIAHNDVYITYKLKYIAIFDALNVLLAETKNDFLDLIYIAGFNGNLKGIEYKKTPINDDDYKKYLENKKQK